MVYQNQGTSERRRLFGCISSSRASRTGFSLLELLVVIGMVVLLLGILLPVLAKARESANQVECAGNLRQLASAFNMYAQASEGQAPSVAWAGSEKSFDWVFWQEPPYGTRNVNDSALATYLNVRDANLRRLLRCPGDTTSVKAGYPFSYCMNAGLWLKGHLGVYRVRDAGNKALFYDAQKPDDGSFWYGAVESDFLADRHSHQGNVAFFDGHVESEPPAFGRDRQYNDPLF